MFGDAGSGMIELPLERLPTSPSDRHALLREYFCDIDAIAESTPNCWRLQLAWPGGVDRHVDPNLAAGLAWWAGDMRRESMYSARRRMGRVTYSLYDSWTLHAWSEWLAENDPSDRRVVILHVDDHRDIGTPRLAARGGGFVDMITGEVVNLRNPPSVEDAINSGAIGMGSFLTPWLHSCPNTKVRHLCQPPKARKTRDYVISLGQENDTLLDLQAVRPSVALDVVSPGAAAQYRHTNDVRDWLAGLDRDADLLLHIDLDYFNNRYDGDSDWPTRAERLDPGRKQIEARIDELTSALRSAGPILSAAIAFSPGFFPSEFWEFTAQRLRSGLPELHGD